ncbi:hypothetical protein C8J42_1024 [Sphingomonas sp. PP-CE-1A-559]|nr:hypothetical protein C8J42_1024 [Sphingomonas sp. PP-CE-1A-559]
MVTSCALKFNRSSFVGPASCGEVSCKKRLSSGKSDDRSSSPADRLHRNTTLSRFAVTIGKGYDDVPRRVGIVVDQPVTGFLAIYVGRLLLSPSMRTSIISRPSACAVAVRASPTSGVQDEYRRRSLPSYGCYLRFVASFPCCRIGEAVGLRRLKRVEISINLDVFDCGHLWRSSTIATSCSRIGSVSRKGFPART